MITGRVLKELSEERIRCLTHLYNAILRTSHFPPQWKVAQVTMILKPGKPADDVKSYRPISLLPIPSKVFETLLLKRLMPVIEEQNLIPSHQFGFRPKHATIDQIHRIVRQINKEMEGKRYCAAAFLDISQAFDKVWHEGLLYKIKKNLPLNYYYILKSYLQNRHFFVKQGERTTKLHEIYSGVPQGSVLGPILYLLYTADLPTNSQRTFATFADDTAIMAAHENPVMASRLLQGSLD